MPMASKVYTTESFSEQAQRRTYSESNIINISSPLPSQAIFLKQKTFSLKKERPPNYHNHKPPPTPKTYVESAGIFSSKKKCKRPHSISFIHGATPLISRYYEEKKCDSYFNQCFDIICNLGTGSFGEVFKVRSKDDKKYYAVKKSKEKFRGESDRLRKIEEVRKYERLPQHRNCVRFYKAWEEKDILYIQLELCDYSLSQYSEENHDIPESTIWQYLVDLLLAIKHLHDYNLVHLDIKPENIFVSKNDICKLGDFGLMLDMSKLNNSEPIEGDSKYLAPELMSGIFTKAADIFSLGITILELACDLDLPHGDDTWHQLRQKQVPMEFLKNLSPELTEVILVMMEPDYKARPTVDVVLAMESVHKAHEQRKLVLEMEELSNSNSYSESSSPDNEVFLSSKTSFTSPVNNSYAYYTYPTSPYLHKDFDNRLTEHKTSFNGFSSNSRLRGISGYTTKSFSYELSNPRMTSSPKLSRRILPFQCSDNATDIDDDCIPFVRPQKLLNLFNEQSSDTSF